jgi:hypothetical protein
MTTLNVSLSAKLQATLGHPGVWAYTVFFDSKGAHPTWKELVLNGTVQSSGQATLKLPEPYDAGKVYFLVQSQAPGDKPANLLYDSAKPADSKIKIEADINWTQAKAWDMRYDSIEVTLGNNPNDAGNLTSVNGFGLPMELSVTYSDNSVSTRGYNSKASDLFTQFTTIGDSNGVENYSVGPLNGTSRMAISPAMSVAPNSGSTTFKAADWDNYIGTL